MRKLVVVVCCVVAIDAMLSTALAPLLPGLTRTYRLSTIDASMLVAAYYLGLASVAWPMVVLSGHVSARRATRDGILLLGLGTVGFALAPGFAALVAARCLQGGGAMLCWSGASGWLVDSTPRTRRGYTIGLLAGVSSGGAIAGPVLGAIASAGGRMPTFLALGGLAVGLAATTLFFGDPVATYDSNPATALLTTLRLRDLGLALWLVSLPATMLGSLGVLGPLALSRAGWSALGVAVTYCGAAFAGLLIRPIVGSLADKHGRFLPVGILLVSSVPVTLAINYESRPWVLAAGVIVAVTIFGSIWGPAMALLSDLCSRASVSQTLAFVVALLGMAPGSVFGALAAGASSQLLGDLASYCIMAAICAGTVVGATPLRRSFSGSPGLHWHRARR